MNKSQKRRSCKIVKSGARSRSRSTSRERTDTRGRTGTRPSSRGRSGTRRTSRGRSGTRPTSRGRTGTIVRINNIELEVGNDYAFSDEDRYRCTRIDEVSDTYYFDRYHNNENIGETSMNKNALGRELRAKIERIRAE
jgi:hypothetical protein